MKNANIKANDKGERGDTADRAMGFTGQLAALGCTGMYRALLECNGLF